MAAKSPRGPPSLLYLFNQGEEPHNTSQPHQYVVCVCFVLCVVLGWLAWWKISRKVQHTARRGQARKRRSRSDKNDPTRKGGGSAGPPPKTGLRPEPSERPGVSPPRPDPPRHTGPHLKP